MANPFGSDTADYGTLSGRSSGFQGRDEFSSLQQSIGNAILEIRRSTQTLRSLESQVGTLTDSEELRRKIQALMRTSMGKVVTAREQLNDLNEMIRGSTDRGQQIAVQKVQQSLSDAVNEFQNMSQRVIEKLQDNPNVPHSGTPQSPGFLDSADVVRHEESARLLRNTPDRVVQQQEFLVSDEAAYVEERAERMEELEHDIVTLNQIMNEIGGMVAQQGEQINTIEGHVETTATNVTRGNRELEAGVRFKKCSRKLTCCIVITVVVLLLILLIIGVVVGCTASKKC